MVKITGQVTLQESLLNMNQVRIMITSADIRCHDSKSPENAKKDHIYIRHCFRFTSQKPG